MVLVLVSKRAVGETFHILRFPKPHEVKEQKQWKQWNVWVVSYASYYTKYYDVNTGFLVGEDSDDKVKILVDKKISGGGL